jgi:hypothetical protein
MARCGEIRGIAAATGGNFCPALSFPCVGKGAAA